jgi:hypothetical protein
VALIVIVLALIGAGVVGRLVWRAGTRSARVLRAANQFQVTSIEALNAIGEGDQFRQIRAIAAWESARAFIRTLSPDEQRDAAQMLAGRGFPTAQVGKAITAFVEATDSESPELDAQLASVMSAHTAAA